MSSTLAASASAAPPPERQSLGRLIMRVAGVLLLAVTAVQTLYTLGFTSFGFETWRPVAFAYLVWSVALCVGQVLTRGEAGEKALFVLPAVLFTVAVVIFPTLFGLYIAFTDWNLSSAAGPQFNGTANLVQLWHDAFFWNALGNMVFYVAMVLVQYAIAFGLALLLNAEIKARKFFASPSSCPSCCRRWRSPG